MGQKSSSAKKKPSIFRNTEQASTQPRQPAQVAFSRSGQVSQQSSVSSAAQPVRLNRQSQPSTPVRPSAFADVDLYVLPGQPAQDDTLVARPQTPPTDITQIPELY